MFDDIFFPHTAERYRAAPLAEQRERYLVHLKATGARRSTLRKCANDQLSLVCLLNLQGWRPAKPVANRGCSGVVGAAEGTPVRSDRVAQESKPLRQPRSSMAGLSGLA